MSPEPAMVSRSMAAAQRLAGAVDRIQRSSKWHRNMVAFATGAISILAFAPFYISPILFLTLPVVIWLAVPEQISAASIHEAGSWRAQAATACLRGFAVGWWFGFGFHLTGLYWIGGAFLVQADVFAWLLPFAVTLMPAGLAIFHALALAAVACTRGGPIVRVLALALALFVSEWLRGNILTGFPWNVLGYALAYPLTLMQSAGVVGIYGLTLLTVIVFAMPLVVFAEVRDRSGVVKAGLATLLATIAPIALMFGYGWVVLSEPDAGTVPNVKLRLVQPSIVQADKFLPEKRREIFERHLSLSRDGPRAKFNGAGGFGDVTHVVWPEASLPFLALRTPEVAERIAQVFPDHVTLVAGTLRLDGPLVRDGRRLKIYNSAFVMGGDGRVLSIYDKVHLVPFGEYLPFQDALEAIGLEQITRIRGGFAVGAAPRPVLNVPGLPPANMLICYEIVFPDEIIVGGQRPGVLINLTNDAWYGTSSGPYQHFQQSRVRAVEQGLPLIRVGNNGISATIDARGRTIAALALDDVDVIDTPLPRSISPPFYARYGDAVSWAMATLLLLSLGIIGCGKFCRNSR